MFANSFALAAVKLPVIEVALPAGVAPCTTGALTTFESSTNAACLPMFCEVNSAQVSLPLDLNVRLISYRACCELNPDVASAISWPSMMLGSSR